jgi:hypothetical protein
MSNKKFFKMHIRKVGGGGVISVGGVGSVGSVVNVKNFPENSESRLNDPFSPNPPGATPLATLTTPLKIVKCC